MTPERLFVGVKKKIDRQKYRGMRNLFSGMEVLPVTWSGLPLSWSEVIDIQHSGGN